MLLRLPQTDGSRAKTATTKQTSTHVISSKDDERPFVCNSKYYG